LHISIDKQVQDWMSK